MQKFVVDCWNGVMDHNQNPLRHIQDLQVRHMVLQVLAWMWCLIFAMSVGSWTVWGISVIAHLLLIAGIVVTVGTFATAKRAPNSFDFIKGYHSGRSRNTVWINGKPTKLPAGDPGGEHE